jgi:hypothetical protein
MVFKRIKIMIIDASINGVKETPKRGGFIDIYWEDECGEFGHILLYSSADGELQIDSEHMGKEFIKKVFNKLVDNAKLME